MLVELRPLSDIRPYDKNPRHNDAAIDAVAASIRQFGFRQPLVVDEAGVIIIGHTRAKAAARLGMDQVPVHVAKGLSEAQAKALRIADNQTASIATWDYNLLPVELADLVALDFDMSLLGFDDKDLAKLLNAGGSEGLIDPDEVPAPPDEATTQPGDLWLLGKHRLLCGDSAKPQDVDRLVDGELMHLVNADPPYNVKVEPRSNNAIAAGLSSFQTVQTASGSRVDADQQRADLKRYPEKAKGTSKKLRPKDRPLANDFVSDEAFEQMLLAWFGNMARVLIPGGGFYLWGGYANCANYPPALKANGLYFSQTIIWDKEHPVLTRKDFMGAHEWCFYGWKEGAAHRFFGPANIPDLWHVKKINPTAMVHLTEKPVELAARAIEYSSQPGENVLDLFGGSGSTLIACEQQGRRGFLMELDPLYCDVILQRWASFTQKQPVLERTGEVFTCRS